MAIGSPMPDESSYIFPGPTPANARTVHISLEPQVLARSNPTDLSIVSDNRRSHFRPARRGEKSCHQAAAAFHK